jgi:RNA-binding protein
VYRKPPSRPKSPKPARSAPKKRAAKQPAAAPRARRVPAEKDERPAPVLSALRRRQLRADAHALEPVVQVGHGGVSEPVVLAVRRALTDHELIKVRLHEPEDKQAMAELLAQETRAALCGLVGHTVILFRPKPRQKGVSGVARSAIKRNQTRQGKRGHARAK